MNEINERMFEMNSDELKKIRFLISEFFPNK